MKQTFKKGTHVDKVIEDAQDIIEDMMDSLVDGKGRYNNQNQLKKTITVEVRIK